MEINNKPDDFNGLNAGQKSDPSGLDLSTEVADWYNPDGEVDNNYYSQQGSSYSSMSLEKKNDLIKNIIHSMSSIDGPNKDLIINKQLCHWFRTDINLGITVAKGLKLDMGEMMKQMPQML